VGEIVLALDLNDRKKEDNHIQQGRPLASQRGSVIQKGTIKMEGKRAGKYSVRLPKRGEFTSFVLAQIEARS